VLFAVLACAHVTPYPQMFCRATGIAPTGMSSLASSLPSSGASSLSTSLSNFDPSQAQAEKRVHPTMTPRIDRDVDQVLKPPRTPRATSAQKSSERAQSPVRQIVVHPLQQRPLHHRRDDPLSTSSAATSFAPPPVPSEGVESAEAAKIRKLEYIARSEQEGRVHLEHKLDEAKREQGQLHAQLEEVKQSLAAQHAEAVDKQILIQHEIQIWAKQFEDLRTLVILGNQAQTKMQDELDYYRNEVETRDSELLAVRQQLADSDQALHELELEYERLLSSKEVGDGTEGQQTSHPNADKRDGGSETANRADISQKRRAQAQGNAPISSPQVLRTTPRTPPVMPERALAR